jgi:diguanylate cyclase (GGDEF)-like protein
MLILDLRPFIVLGGFIGLLMSLVMFFMRRTYPSTFRGLRDWMAAPIVSALSAVLFGLRGVIPEFVSVVVANLLLYSAFLLYYFGSRRFYGLRRKLLPWVLLGIPLGGLLQWYSQVDPQYGVRMAIFDAVAALVFARHCMLYLQQGLRGFAPRFMLAVLLIQLATLLSRLVLVALGHGGLNLTEPTLLQMAYVAVFSFSVLALSIGAILMATERLRVELENLATHDPLTGALGRGATLQACERELARCRRHGTTVAVIMVDLDHFKAINDTHGHQMGDAVLVDFVQRASALLRSNDSIGRYGGEEFLVLLPDTDLNAAAATAERIRNGLQMGRTHVPPYTFSAGVACSHSAHPTETVAGLIARADMAMYQAKAAGRDKIVVSKH